MTEFVLVPGAWLGSWAWSEVVPQLRAAAHGAHAVTLSGLAERAGEPVGRQTHVNDVVQAVEAADRHDVVLVGHSYSGIPVGQAATRLGDRLTRMILLDAEVPVPGGSFVSGWPTGRPVIEAAIAANDGYWPPPPAADFEGQGLTAEQVERLVGGSTPHPGATLTEPAELLRPLAEIPTTYVKCLLDGPTPNDEVAGLLRGDRWRLAEVDTGHWPMFSRPVELAQLLISESARPV